MRETLEKLFRAEFLTKEEAAFALRKIALGEVPAAQIAAFLTGFRMRHVTTTELSGFRQAMLELAIPLTTERDVVDLCGTGGDGKNTFNISTATAFVVAACGSPVAKHGNYGTTSTCGSSNVLEYLNVPFGRDQTHVNQQLKAANLTFLHAPQWHPATKLVAPVRKELGFKTIFNLLGPLVNPVRPRFQVLGVHSPQLQELYAGLLQIAGVHFAVVHSKDGYDEISLTSVAQASTVTGVIDLSPSRFGADHVRPSDLLCGTKVSDFAECLIAILSGKGTVAQNSVVAANAAVAIALTRSSQDFPSCYQEALEVIRSGTALKTLTTLMELG